MGPWDMAGWVPGIAPPSHPVLPLPRVHPSPPLRCAKRAVRLRAEYKVVVGLISVAQLTLGAIFSDIRGMTEVYNLIKIGNR